MTEIEEEVKRVVKSCQESGNWSYGYMMLGRWKEDLKNLAYRPSTRIFFVGEPYSQAKAMILLWRQLPEKPTWLRPQELIKFKKTYK